MLLQLHTRLLLFLLSVKKENYLISFVLLSFRLIKLKSKKKNLNVNTFYFYQKRKANDKRVVQRDIAQQLRLNSFEPKGTKEQQIPVPVNVVGRETRVVCVVVSSPNFLR